MQDSIANEDRNLGIELYEQGRFTESVEPLRRVLVRDPRDSRCLRLLAHALFDSGRVREAIARFRQLIVLNADDPQCHNDLGFALTHLGEMKQAASALERAIALDPRFTLAHNNLGNLQLQRGRVADAEKHYRLAIAIDPIWAMPRANLGALLLGQGQTHEAAAAYREALACDPLGVEAANGLGAALLASGRTDDAVVQLRLALASAPDHVPVRINLGRALRAAGAVTEAIAMHRSVTEASPDAAEAWDELALDLLAADDIEGATACARKAIALNPRRAQSHVHLGNILADANALPAAVAAYRQALRLSPDLPRARWNLALAELAQGDFRNGWSDYEARWDCAEFPSPRRAFAQPKLERSSDLAGKTVLVHAEQGYGDTILFVRYIALLAARCASVILEVPRPLAALSRTCDGVAQLVTEGDTLPPFDFHIPLLSLPLMLDRLVPDGLAVPYLSAPAARHADEPAKTPRRRRVGITWSGSGVIANDRRSIRLEQLLAWFDLADIEWIGLQKDIPQRDAELVRTLQATHPKLSSGASLEDFSHTASVIADLDLVVSIDTAVAHLAGAMGKPLWVLLPFAPDFRWMLDRDDSPWYPTARLFRAPAPSLWESVIDAVRGALSSPGSFGDQRPAASSRSSS